jgi:hypothetical protein
MDELSHVGVETVWFNEPGLPEPVFTYPGTRAHDGNPVEVARQSIQIMRIFIRNRHFSIILVY